MLKYSIEALLKGLSLDGYEAKTAHCGCAEVSSFVLAIHAGSLVANRMTRP